MHMSVKQYNLLIKFDNLLTVRSDKQNRYYILFLFFYKDYFIHKLVNKLMLAGQKDKALRTIRSTFFLLKKSIGFQPFFLFKNIVFRMRQIFKINTVIIRSRASYLPVLIQANKQVAYGVTNIVTSARKLKKEERITMFHALYIVLLNSFFRT